MNGRNDLRSLVSRALGDLASGVTLSAILEQCIRIAELRQDLGNAWPRHMAEVLAEVVV